MKTERRVHQYLVLNTQSLIDGLPSVVEDRERRGDIPVPQARFDPKAVKTFLLDLLARYGHDLASESVEIEDIPTVELVASDRKHGRVGHRAENTVVAVSSANECDAKAFRRAALAAIQGSGGETLRDVGVNPLLGGAQYAAPTASNGSLFGTSDDARRMTHFNQLTEQLTGTNVNVVVIDTGFDKNIVPPGQFMDGWLVMPSNLNLYNASPPGMTTGELSVHATMIVNTIRSFAPDARFFDVPVIPPFKIDDLPTFLHMIAAVYLQIVEDIIDMRASGSITGPWILMNAWGVYDRESERPFLGEYTENLGPCGTGLAPHPFIARVEYAAANGIDMVFAAGNCGEVSPDCRCGGNDYGPNRSIWGANAHGDVVTASAVRVDGMWLGFSSEGEGPTPYLEQYKPDLCAPAQFVDLNGGYPPTDGTSGAAAVVAGIVAALRSRVQWGQSAIPPQALRGALIASANQTGGTGWNRWFGNGVIDAVGAYNALKKLVS